MASLFDAAARNPGEGDPDHDVGVRWIFPFTAFATTANATRAHLIANNELAGGVTPATFQDQGGTEKRIDWFVFHHGNDFVILNLDSSVSNATEVDYRVAFRESGTTNIWDYPLSSDASDSDPYEMPSLQSALDALVAVITGGGTLDAIIYDRSVASALDGWDSVTLTYDATEQLAMAARAGNPTAAFDLRVIAAATPEELSMAARAGNPTAAFDLRALDAPATTITVDAGADASVRGNRQETYQISDAAVTVQNAMGPTTYSWQRIGGPHAADLDDDSILNPTVQDTNDVSTDTVITYRLTATNNGVSASDTIRITITPDLRAPTFPNATGTDQAWTIGDFVQLRIPTANGNPTPTYTGAGLPAGLEVHYPYVQGRPTTAGSGTVVITATNTEGSDTWSFDWVVSAPPTQELAMEAEAGDPTAAFALSAIGPPMHLSMAARAGNPTAAFGNLRAVERRVRFSHAGRVGTNLAHHPAGMYTAMGVFWLGEIEIRQVDGTAVEVAIERGGSTVNAAEFVETWGNDWALYLIDETTREYAALRARLIHRADHERIAWRSPTWQVVASNVADVAEWILDLVGTLQVAIAPFDDYRPYP